MQPHQLNTEIFIGRAKAIHGEKYDYSEVEYKNARTRVIVICRTCGHRWRVLPYNHTKGQGCGRCSHEISNQNNTLSQEQFLEKARDLHGEKYEYLSEYQGSRVYLEIRCIPCDFVFQQTASNHLLGHGCHQCWQKNAFRPKPMEASVFEERCKQVHNDRYTYFGDYKGAKKKIKVLCKKCLFEFNQKADTHLNGCGCSKCASSKGELEIERVLKMFGVEFEVQKRFEWCFRVLPLAFDFFIPSHNLCVEYQGVQHYIPVETFGGEGYLNEVFESDEIKREFCKQNGIDLLDIPYFEFDDIEKILKVEFGL